MISKNNNNQKLSQVAERQDHFGIRKLTVGAVSVILGTSLWLGVDNNVAHADVEGQKEAASDPNVASESRKSVNTAKVEKVVVETSSAPAQNTEKETSTTNTAQTSPAENKEETAAAQAETESQKAQTPQAETKVTQNISATQSEAKNAPQTSNKPTENVATEKQTSNNAAAITQTVPKHDTIQTSQVTAPKENQSTETKDNAQATHHVKITNIDDATGETLSGSDSFDAKTGDSSHVIFTNRTGYKLMNPEVLDGYEIENYALGHGNLVVPDHDVDLTLHFLPLAPTTVEYVDTDGNLLTKFSTSSQASTSKSIHSDIDGIENSKFDARAIDIPGYELVSAPEIKADITQVSTKDNLNPMVLKFVYKKIAPTADQGLPNGGGAGITGVGTDYGIKWDSLADGVNLDLTKDTYGDNNYEAVVQKMQDTYLKQGFSFLGVLNDHQDTDKTNRMEYYISVHFLQHKPVTVNYVDQDGNKLTDSVELAFNKANPDQTNNGINPEAHWYPNGEWQSEEKSFEGYKLQKVLGATKGKFTTFNYTVTYVYTNQTSGDVAYIDDTDGQTLKDVDLNGKIGTQIDYSTADEIANYEKQGYELVSDDFSNGIKTFNADEKQNKFTIHLKHKIVTTTDSQNGQQIIHYVYEDGHPASADNTQSTTFVKTTTTDAVSGNVIDSKWEPATYSFDNVTSPTIDGYHPDQEQVAGTTVTPDKSGSEITVTYVKNGNEVRNQTTKPSTQTIKFVDEEGNELQKAVVSPVFNYEYSGDTFDTYTGKQVQKGTWNADSHTFETINVPVIAGYVAVDGFSKKNNQILAGGLTSNRDNLNVVGEVIYRRIGKIVPVDSSGKEIPNVPTPTYTNDPTDPTEVTPNEPVPNIPNYTPEKSTVTPTDPSTDTPVIYHPDEKITTVEGKQIIHFVDGETNQPLRDPDTQTHDFKITNGQPDTPDYTFKIVNVPVVPGYVAQVKTAGGETITPANPVAEVTVIYHRIGKIVPVDPSGKEIPNAPTPTYTNDPTDPTKVAPNEPVPNVPGYRPVNPSPITPQNPTQDTKVPYTKDPEAVKVTGKVNYIDDTTGQTMQIDNLEGNVGEKITYTTKSTISTFENKGYELVSNNFRDGNETFAKDSNDFEVHFKHVIVPVNPQNPANPGQPINPNDPNGPKWPAGTDSKSLTKTGTQTVHYQGAGTQTPKDNVSTVEFQHEVLVDKVTGQIVKDNGWSKSQTFKTITTPTINGYTADKQFVGGETVSLDKNGNGEINKSYMVTYTPNPAPAPHPETMPTQPSEVVPNEPTSDTPSTPQIPEPVQPTMPQTDDNVETIRPLPQQTPTKAPTTPTVAKTEQTKPHSTVETIKPHAAEPVQKAKTVKAQTVKSHSHVIQNSVAVSTPETKHTVATSTSPTKQTLPQTGEVDDTGALIAGSLASGLGLIGLAGIKKRKND